MKIQRTIPPAAAPLGLLDIFYGVLGMFSARRYTSMLEEKIRDYFGVKHVFLMSSGKASLALILRVLASKDSRYEVIIPAYTCYSVPSAIVKEGLKIKLCDIEESTLDYNYDELEIKADKNTLCILSGNLFGIPSNAKRIKIICEQTGAFFIEDAAQAMGSIFQQRYIGTNGDVGFFSLGRGKNVACNSGGIIITDSNDLGERLAVEYAGLQMPGIRSTFVELAMSVGMYVFMKPFLYWLPSGLPFLKLGETIFYNDFNIEKLSGLKAGLMVRWKSRLQKSEQYRIKNISKLCDDSSLSYPCIRLPCVPESIDTANAIFSESQDKGLGVSKMYPTAINEIPEIKHMFEENGYPIAASVAKRLLGIPTHELMKEKDVRNLKTLFRRYLTRKSMCKYIAGSVDF